MEGERAAKKYDLEGRALIFAKQAHVYVNLLPKTISNLEIAKQLARSAGSVGANYIEANESLGKKDFLMRIRISRKEAKESVYWLDLSVPRPEQEKQKGDLLSEATQLMRIFGAILVKSNSKS